MSCWRLKGVGECRRLASFRRCQYICTYIAQQYEPGLGPGNQLGGQRIWFRANGYMETDVRNRPSGIKVTFRISEALPTVECQP